MWYFTVGKVGTLINYLICVHYVLKSFNVESNNVQHISTF